MKDDLLNRAIVRAVHGDPSPWPLDPAHPPRGTFEDRFKAGDKQILLWAIRDCAERGETIPKWAAEALHTVLMGAAKFEFETWDGAFGKIRGKGTYRNRIRDLAKYVIPVGERICELHKQGRAIGNSLFEELGEKEFLIGARRVKTYWSFFKRLQGAESASQNGPLLSS
jgi:hypothetical protein